MVWKSQDKNNDVQNGRENSRKEWKKREKTCELTNKKDSMGGLIRKLMKHREHQTDSA